MCDSCFLLSSGLLSCAYFFFIFSAPLLELSLSMYCSHIRNCTIIDLQRDQRCKATELPKFIPLDSGQDVHVREVWMEGHCQAQLSWNEYDCYEIGSELKACAAFFPPTALLLFPSPRHTQQTSLTRNER